MIEAYITYDRYEHNEWFSVFHIGRDYNKAYNQCIEKDLPEFIEYGPDDCHSFRLIMVYLPNNKYYQLRKWVLAKELTNEEQRAFDDFMIRIHEGEFETEEYLFTDGSSDYYDVLSYHLGERPHYDDYDSDKEYEEAMDEYNAKVDEFQADDELFGRVLREYIASAY